MRNTRKVSIFVLILSLLIVRPTLSYADRHGHEGGYGHEHGHTSFGFDLSLWPDRYYYDPVYYPVSDYVLVSPPNYQPVVINGATYYLNNGNYYAYTGYGYQLISPPAAVMPVASAITMLQAPPAATAAPIQVTSATSADTDDSFTLNIPNDKGGYTAVVIKRSGQGFVGPQGEFYPEFPKVSQLKVMYSK